VLAQNQQLVEQNLSLLKHTMELMESVRRLSATLQALDSPRAATPEANRSTGLPSHDPEFYRSDYGAEFEDEQQAKLFDAAQAAVREAFASQRPEA
jgi:hypothetical protein